MSERDHISAQPLVTSGLYRAVTWMFVLGYFVAVVQIGNRRLQVPLVQYTELAATGAALIRVAVGRHPRAMARQFALLTVAVVVA